jgi:hypothetical protein
MQIFTPKALKNILFMKMQNKRYMAKIFMFVFVYASIVSLSIAVNTYMQSMFFAHHFQIYLIYYIYIYMYNILVTSFFLILYDNAAKLPCKSDADCPRARGRYIWQCCDGFCKLINFIPFRIQFYAII